MQTGIARKITRHPMLVRARELEAAAQLPYFIAADNEPGNRVRVEGRTCINLSTSNYLGLSQDPRLKAAAVEAVERYGTSCTASRILYGTKSLHLALESELAAFLGKEAAIVFPTGYLANVGVVPALAGRHDDILFDAEVHACLIDGIQLSGARTHRFRHNDVDDLARRLREAEGNVKLVVVDSLYSMAGDMAPLAEIAELCGQHEAMLFVDDAHGIGVLGRDGRGCVDHFGLTDEVDVIMGVFSKSFGSVGGFVAGDAELMEYLRFAARTHMFSNALPPPQTAAALAALRLMANGETDPGRTLDVAARARSRLREIGYRVGGDGAHLVPVFVGDDEATLALARRLLERGIVTGPAISPAVPPGRGLLRIVFPPVLGEDELDEVFDAFERVGRELGLVDTVRQKDREPAPAP